PYCLINLTNDAWFGDSGEPQQHMALSIFRTVEERLDLARCTKSGISAFIDASGQVSQQSAVQDPYAGTRLLPPTTLLGEVALMRPRGFFLSLGDLFSWLLLAASIALLVDARRAS